MSPWFRLVVASLLVLPAAAQAPCPALESAGSGHGTRRPIHKRAFGRGAFDVSSCLVHGSDFVHESIKAQQGMEVYAMEDIAYGPSPPEQEPRMS